MYGLSWIRSILLIRQFFTLGSCPNLQTQQRVYWVDNFLPALVSTISLQSVYYSAVPVQCQNGVELQQSAATVQLYNGTWSAAPQLQCARLESQQHKLTFAGNISTKEKSKSQKVFQATNKRQKHWKQQTMWTFLRIIYQTETTKLGKATNKMEKLCKRHLLSSNAQKIFQLHFILEHLIFAFFVQQKS